MLFNSWTSHFYALLIHPTESKILLEKSNNNYNLPLVKSNQGIWLDNLIKVNTKLGNEFKRVLFNIKVKEVKREK